MKKYIYFAVALLGLASCTSEDFVGDEDLRIANENTAISFGFNVPTPTRALEDAAAATALSSQFIVYGEKGETDGTAPAAGNLVFQNYKVTYTASTAYTTTSNTDDWEYVGLSWTSAEQSNITTSTTDVQSIKFWDDAASSYTFTAVSALPADIQNGRVTITKTTSGSDQYAKGYSIVLAKDASDNYPDLSKLYFADRNNIAKGDGYSHNAVKMNFRNTQSHVRVGVFETIPGYKVSAIHFFKQNGTTEYNDGASTPTNAFGAVCPNISGTNYEGTLTVTYGNGTNAALNQPIVGVSGTPATDLVLGTNYSTLTVGNPSAEPAVAAKFLGETATTATYDTNGGTYTIVMPQEGNTTNLKLKVNYTLYNEITKETITITGKTAEIPGKYLAWKPNYKYTYLFKITDDDLNPITFDAAVIEAADGKAEYITTVTEPSITTFGVSGGKYVTDKNEYEAGNDIYATFVVGSTVQTPQLGINNATNYVQIYQVTTSDADNFPITEASVAERLAVTPAGTAKITCTNVTTSNDGTYFTNTESPSVVTSVPAEDGTTKTINAVKLPGAKENTYAIEFVTYEAVTLAADASLVGYYLESSGTYTIQNSGTYSSGTYYKQVKTYKIIKVAAVPTP